MVRISGFDIPGDKRIEVALTYIEGIGRSLSNRILEKVGVDKNIRARDLSSEQLTRIREEIEKHYTVGGALSQMVRLNIKRLREIRCYRGLRHEKGLPVRGQRTRTNARTRKGRKQTIGGTGAVRERH